MVRRLITQDLCDDCDYNGIPEMEAVHEHILAIDGDKPRRVLLCRRCELEWATIITIYREMGQDASPAVPKAAPKKPVRRKQDAKVIEAAAPKELESASAEERPEQPAVKAPKPKILCSEDHKGRGPKEVVYEARNTHAVACHRGARIWDIVWGDPHKILTVHCTAHAECEQVGLGFTTSYGLEQHIRVCPLPRVDQGGLTFPALEDTEGRSIQQEPR